MPAAPPIMYVLICSIKCSLTAISGKRPKDSLLEEGETETEGAEAILDVEQKAKESKHQERRRHLSYQVYTYVYTI